MRVSRERLWGWQVLLCVGGAVALTGCAVVGSKYHEPEVALPEVTVALPAGIETEPDFAEAGLDVWWELFTDETLTALVLLGHESNRDLQTAVARIEESVALARAARGAYFPALSASAGAFATRQSEALVPELPTYLNRDETLYQAGFTMAWELDVWGRIRRAVESADAAAAATREDRRDVQVLLSSQIADVYITLRSIQGRIAYLSENLAAQASTLELTKQREQAGLVPLLDVHQAQLNLSSSQAALPALRSLLAQTLNQLILLVGGDVGDLRPALKASGPIPAVDPARLVTISRNTLRERSDVRRAERLLASQMAQVGVSEGDLYPALQLPGTVSWEAYDAGEMGDGLAYTVGPALSWRLYEGGRLRALVEAEEARVGQAMAQYEQALLRAHEDLESSIVILLEEQQRLVALREAVGAATRSVDAVKALYENGLVDFQNVLDMERSLVSQQDQLAVSEGQVGQGHVRLYKALGGEWSGVESARE